jgi:hypothetical protein
LALEGLDVTPLGIVPLLQFVNRAFEPIANLAREFCKLVLLLPSKVQRGSVSFTERQDFRQRSPLDNNSLVSPHKLKPLWRKSGLG